MRNCKFHIKENKAGCQWCKKWRDSFKYFKKKKSSHLTVYCALMQHYRTGERFYKIGITSQSTDQRFDEIRERYYVKILWEDILPLYEATIREMDLLYYYQVLEDRKYMPKARFSGFTECIKYYQKEKEDENTTEHA